ncbi:ShlB/FhaC/HecB family hemolysin secretion/activation protein [Herbaspirillum sp. RV1423]|uniref:ShlB/FhaC/HecB family hemolysin secretion/activation protein n=1 Tax=Herbaspirillum sp. RV1423 TaxID=1443993 RepID=UPI0004B30ADE|nr:ShlB/FhaC/HecB family hemolysin secretion/activation protein [Herbaspirillum sp. RV1423]
MTLTVAATSALAEDDHFNITRFQVEGNTLLPADEVQSAVAPMIGPGRVYGDVQKALEALEAAYRKAGYSAVQVYVPEQELTGGVVIIRITETVIGKLVVSDNRYFSEENIRASLPQLQSGKAPNLNAISQAVQLSNDNPAKQVNVTLGVSDDEGKIDADVKVVDNNPLRVFMTLDNTGAAATGKWRTGAAIQHANLFGRDQVGTLAYTTSPDKPSGVNVDLYSVGYRIPLYSIGDSIDLIYGKSNVSTGSSPTLGGVLGFTGKGDVYGVRWNHFFAREGETSTKLVVGLDYKRIGSQCNFNGSAIEGVGTCVPYDTMPLSVTYSGQRRGVMQNVDYNIGIARNWATGPTYTAGDRTDHYSFVTPGGRNTNDNFVILRGGASIFQGFANDWQMRVAGTAQYAKDPLVSAEQFGMVGATAVRGFTERAVAADSGLIVNAEVYTPELAAKGNLRLLAFYDIGRGYNNSVVSGNGLPSSLTVSSIGIGARYALGRDFNVRLDVARVAKAGTSTTESRGDLNAHLSATLGF